MQNPIMASVGKKGVNRAQDVGIIQHLLNRAATLRGVPTDPIEVDGVFGPQTEKALRDFQKRYGLTVDGKADPNEDTIVKLNQMAGANPRLNDGYSFLEPEIGPTRLV